MILIELLILLATLFPIFHLLNVIFTSIKKRQINEEPEKEQKLSILIPCFNEEDTVRFSIEGLLRMNYKAYIAIYINDGSTDRTLDVLNERLKLELIGKNIINEYAYNIKAVYRSSIHANFYVIDKANGGKNECLNLGLVFFKPELIVILDADSVLEKNALKHMNRVMQDRNIVAAGGPIHIMQGYQSNYMHKKMKLSKRILISLQILDYLKGFYIYKMSLYKQNATAIISGAFGVFRRDILMAVNGFRKTLGEDIDITLRIQKLIHKTKQKIVFLPNALCFTQCPEKWSDLIKQRMRWQKGFINSSVYNRWFIIKTFFYKSVTFHFFVEALLVGFASSFFTFFTIVFVFVITFGNTANLFAFGIYFILRIMISVLYSLGAIYISKKYYPYPCETLKQIYLIILLDVTFFWLFTIIVYMAGIVSYLWYPNKINEWNKVERSKEIFN